MPHLALFRKREKQRAWRRNWASVSLCDLTQASHFIGVATPLLWVYELAPLSRFGSMCILGVHVHCLPSPAQAHVCRDCEYVRASVCVCMWETGYHIVPGKPHLACQGSWAHRIQFQASKTTSMKASAVSCIGVS